MYEHVKLPVAPRKAYYLRLLRNLFIGLVLIVIALWIGILGYHFLEHQSWIDAFVSASMILSGMGPTSPLTTYEGKVFAGFYALFSGLTFILIVGIILAPVVHRFFHQFHVDTEEREKTKKKN